ncbi:hypothetical protein DTO166G4_7954 [Paecilomyces variotii]|nr:hypothetical protein DTO166G4_7954 [Paecilomyces variotii]KAJ9231055.1 hypothetical protein DTO166G5_6970 [Paecilomyces variotii]
MSSSGGILLPREHTRTIVSARGGRALAASITFTFLATCAVAARLYTRMKIIRRIEPNDWMVLVALLFSYLFLGFFIGETVYGMGVPGPQIPPSTLKMQMQNFWITVPMYNTAVICAKASILMQYFHVFPTRGMRIACSIMITVLAIYGTWAVLSGYLNCIPVAKFWDPTIPGYCIDMKALWFSNASMHIFTDIVILVMPLPALRSLDLPQRQRLALMGIFAVGGFVCITSIFRLISLKVIAQSSDPTYDNVGAATWSAIECNVGIICACLPTLRPLISRILPRFLSTRSGGSRPAKRNTFSRGRAPTYRGGTTSSTAGTPGDDLEYGMCSVNMDRVLAGIPLPHPANSHRTGREVRKEEKDSVLLAKEKEFNGSESPSSASGSSR